MKMGLSWNEKMKNETYAKESFWKRVPRKSREIGERKSLADAPKPYPDKREVLFNNVTMNIIKVQIL